MAYIPYPKGIGVLRHSYKRLGIVISIFLPAIMLFVIKPWEGRYIIFILVAILPVALGWAGVWIRDGFKNNNSDE